jgi:DNA-binding NarL/FixJ family response regulator
MSDDEGLTAEEWGIARRLGGGMSRKGIRNYLGVSASALDAMLQGIYRKTGTHSDEELIAWLNSR